MPLLVKQAKACHATAMFKHPLFAVLSVSLICSTSVFAQTPKIPKVPTPASDAENAPGLTRFWQADLPGGEYVIALDRITSVSRHKYLLDGTVMVDEVTVDSIGQALARFYFISPVTDEMNSGAAAQLTARAQQLLDKAGDRVGSNLQNMVVKKYPETTHAKSIEYRLLSAGELTSLYDSVRTSWQSGRGRKFAIASK